MADWEGDPGYFWGHETSHYEADWDFDALNEIDLSAWEEPPLRADAQYSNVHHQNPALQPFPQEANGSSSSHTFSSPNPFPTWQRSPRMHGSSSPFPLDNSASHRPYHMQTGTAASSSAPARRHHERPSSSQRHHRQAATSFAETPPTAPRFLSHLRATSFSASPSGESSEHQEEDASFLVYPEIFDTEEEAGGHHDMPAATAPRRATSSGETVVDLTQESSPPPESSTTRLPRPPKRPAPSDTTANHKPKKRARPSASSTPNSSNPFQPIEAFDLTNETTTAEEEVRRAQQQAAIAAQQAADNGSGPVAIGKRQCIICLEPFTDVTITHCGHIYCHECLTQALNAGEKSSERGVGTCPVCRKPVRRNKQNQMIVVSFMKKETFGKGKRSSLLYGS